MGKKSANEKSDSSGANLGFGAKLWLTADKLRNNMDAAEYKHVVLGLLFLKYISDSFQSRRDELEAELTKRGIKGKSSRKPNSGGSSMSDETNLPAPQGQFLIYADGDRNFRSAWRATPSGLRRSSSPSFTACR